MTRTTAQYPARYSPHVELPEPTTRHEPTQREGMALLATLAVALVVRVYGMFAFPWDQDELYTIYESRVLFHSQLPPGIDSRPLYYLLQHPLIALFSATPAMMRLLPTLFGVAGVWATSRLAKRVAGMPAALAASMLVALSPWHLYASGTARYYSLVYLCAAVAVERLIAAYESDRRRDYAGALAALLVGTATHPTFVFPIVGVTMALSVVRDDGRLGLRWPSRAAWICLWLPYALAVVAGLGTIRVFGHASSVGNMGARSTLANLRLLPAIVEWATPIICVAALIGATVLLRAGGRARRAGAVIIAGLAADVGILVVASRRTGVYADYAIAALPLVFLGCGALAAHVAERWPEARRARVSALFAGLLLVAIAPSIASYFADGMRFDFRPAYRRIASEAPSLAVLTWPEAIRAAYAPSLRGLPIRADSLYLNTALERERGLWAVAAVKRFGIVDDDTGQYESWLSSHCRRVGRFERPRFDYRLYRIELYRCAAPAS